MKKLIYILSLLTVISFAAFSQVVEFQQYEEDRSESAGGEENGEAEGQEDASAGEKKEVQWAPVAGEEAGSEKYTTDEEEEYLDDFEDAEYITGGSSVSTDNRINLPHRTFELGFDVSLDVANNYLNANEMLVKELVFDLRKMADELPDEGFTMNFNVNPDLFMNLNLRNGIHVGVAGGVETYGSLNISRDIFDFLGYGNINVPSVNAEGESYLDAFNYWNVAVGLELFDFHLEIVPAIFLPLVHAETTSMEGSFTNTAEGGFKVNAKASLAMYSCCDLQPVFEEDGGFDKIIEGMREGWGFDLSSSLEKKIFRSFNAKVYSRLPIVPGTLNYKTSMDMNMSWEVDEIKSMFEDGSNVSPTTDIGNKVYSKESYNIHRPFKIGTEVAFRPFGKWCTFGGLLGMGVKNPFSDSAKAYVEYNASVSIDAIAGKWDIVGLRLSTGYLNQNFRHQAGFMLNLRAFELDAGISAQGGTFVSSFKGAGTGVYVMMAFGW